MCIMNRRREHCLQPISFLVVDVFFNWGLSRAVHREHEIFWCKRVTKDCMNVYIVNDVT